MGLLRQGGDHAPRLDHLGCVEPLFQGVPVAFRSAATGRFDVARHLNASLEKDLRRLLPRRPVPGQMHDVRTERADPLPQLLETAQVAAVEHDIAPGSAEGAQQKFLLPLEIQLRLAPWRQPQLEQLRPDRRQRLARQLCQSASNFDP